LENKKGPETLFTLTKRSAERKQIQMILSMTSSIFKSLKNSKQQTWSGKVVGRQRKNWA